CIRVVMECGCMDALIQGISLVLLQIGLSNEFVPSLPVAIMRPFSGGGGRGLMLDVFDKYGVDSFLGNLASIFQGSADSTFYIIALYFGSVGIKKVRYAIWAGLLADFIGVIAAICIAYLFFK
ncbi:MAG: hypothetical protein ACK55T_05675, partial [Bacteroidota bacterium]